MRRATVRWGRVRELDGRARVNSPVYNSYPIRLKELHCWRAAHKLAGSHIPVRMVGTRMRIRPSSNMPLKAKEQMVGKFIKRYE